MARLVTQRPGLRPCGALGHVCPQQLESFDQAACKPGSVPRLAFNEDKTDGQSFLWDGPCGPPRATNPDGARRRACQLPDAHPYSVLLQAGLALPSLSPETRWALTPPFHPYPGQVPGGLLSVALSLGFPVARIPGRTLSAALPTWSPDFPPASHPVKEWPASDCPAARSSAAHTREPWKERFRPFLRPAPFSEASPVF